jgi:hypothetical protein
VKYNQPLKSKNTSCKEFLFKIPLAKAQIIKAKNNKKYLKYEDLKIGRDILFVLITLIIDLTSQIDIIINHSAILTEILLLPKLNENKYPNDPMNSSTKITYTPYSSLIMARTKHNKTIIKKAILLKIGKRYPKSENISAKKISSSVNLNFLPNKFMPFN